MVFFENYTTAPRLNNPAVFLGYRDGCSALNSNVQEPLMWTGRPLAFQGWGGENLFIR